MSIIDGRFVKPLILSVVVCSGACADISFSPPPPPPPEGLNPHLTMPFAFSVLVAGLALSTAVGSTAIIFMRRKGTGIGWKWGTVLVVMLLGTISAAVYAASVQDAWRESVNDPQSHFSSDSDSLSIEVCSQSFEPV